MTYYRLRDQGNRILKSDESGSYIYDPERDEWIGAEETVRGNEEISDEDADMYFLAVKTARKAHEGQKDKGGQDYFNHPLSVASFCQGPFVSLIGAFLHDVVEDTELSLDDLLSLGFSNRAVSCVDSCTRRENEERSAYLERLAQNTDAVYVKLADLKHNSDLSRIPHPGQRDFFRIEKYRREAEYLNEILEKRMNGEER